MTALVQYAGALVLLFLLAAPSGKYLYRVFCREEVFLSDFLIDKEERIYRFLQINPRAAMGWKQYIKALVTFYGVGFLLLYLWIALELHLPHVPEAVTANSWWLALISVVSFLFHTPQPIALGMVAQGMGLVLQNLVAASLIAVSFAMIGTFFPNSKRRINHYWVDFVRVVLYLLFPLAVLCASVLFTLSIVRLAVPVVWLVQLEGSQVFMIFRGAIGLFSLFWLPAALCAAFGRYVQQRLSGVFVCLIAVFLQLTVFSFIQPISPIYGFSLFYSLYQQQSITADLLLLLSQVSKITIGDGPFHLLLFVLLSILFTGCCKSFHQCLTVRWGKYRQTLVK